MARERRPISDTSKKTPDTGIEKKGYQPGENTSAGYQPGETGESEGSNPPTLENTLDSQDSE